MVLVDAERRPRGITIAQLPEARRFPMLKASLYGLDESLPVECVGTHVQPDYNAEVVVRPPVTYGPSLPDRLSPYSASRVAGKERRPTGG